jgi:beta-barrel assembly-enhancing protease
MPTPSAQRRPRLPAFLLALALPLGLAQPLGAQDRNELPAMGSSAERVFTAQHEAEYGAMVFRELRRWGWMLEDPQLVDYLNGVGHRLVVHNPDPVHGFTFFLIPTRDINASSWPGGYISVNAGLVLTAESESELAAVLAHEIAHTTQRHIARMIERQQRDQLPILLAMLGTVVAAQASNSNSAADATGAAIMGFSGLLQQLQINHTRSNEHEADRIGIRTLAQAGYDPMAMASFFGRMQRANRTVGIGAPEYLRSHPVTTTRISEAKDRASKQPLPLDLGIPDSGLPNPLLPGGWLAAAQAPDSNDRLFAWARERLRVATAESTSEVVAHYRRRATGESGLEDAERYGFALALLKANEPQQALDQLAFLGGDDPGHFWVDLAAAEARHRAGQGDAAEADFERLLAKYPRNRAIALSYSERLMERADAASGRRAQDVLRPLMAQGADNPLLQQSFGRASELAGDLVRAGEAHAEHAFLTGRAPDALRQLQRLKERDDLDFYQRARIDARIAAMTPLALEMDRQLRREQQQRLESPAAFAPR